MKTIVALIALLLALPVYAGTWGLGQFENDEALDRSSDWAESGTIGDIRSALEAVQGVAYIEAPEGVTALVAAEVIAAAIGRPSHDLPETLRTWIGQQSAQEIQALLPLARSAILRIRATEGSELYELWANEDPADWLATVRELEQRLASPQARSVP